MFDFLFRKKKDKDDKLGESSNKNMDMIIHSQSNNNDTAINKNVEQPRPAQSMPNCWHLADFEKEHGEMQVDISEEKIEINSREELLKLIEKTDSSIKFDDHHAKQMTKSCLFTDKNGETISAIIALDVSDWDLNNNKSILGVKLEEGHFVVYKLHEMRVYQPGGTERIEWRL